LSSISYKTSGRHISKPITRKIYCAVKLKEKAKITSGIVSYEAGRGKPPQTKEDVKNRIYDSDKKENEEYKQYLVGRNINKYSTMPISTQWIKFGDCLATQRKSLDFTKNKIVIRQTSDHIIAAIDSNGLLNLKSVHNVVIKDNASMNYEYVLCVLNSRLIDFIYRYLVPKIGRVFAEVKAVKLSELPIYPETPEQQKPFIEKADLMLQFNKDLMDEINSFKDWLKHTFNVEKFSKKLDKYYELTFGEFMAELKKKRVDVASRKNYALLKKEFEESISTIHPLIDEISEIDKLIDSMVYDLYGLTDEEIQIVEDNL